MDEANKLSLVHVMAWRRTGDKPLSEPLMTQFNDAYVLPGNNEFSLYVLNSFEDTNTFCICYNVPPLN